jgi:hypothetical protein
MNLLQYSQFCKHQVEDDSIIQLSQFHKILACDHLV